MDLAVNVQMPKEGLDSVYHCCSALKSVLTEFLECSIEMGVIHLERIVD